MRRLFVMMAALILLSTFNAASFDDTPLSVTEFYPEDRDSETDIKIGNVIVAPSAFFDRGARLEALPGDNLATIRTLFETDSGGAALKVILPARGKGMLSVVNVKRSTEGQVIATHFDLMGNGGSLMFDIIPASDFVNPKGFVEIHITVSDGQELDIGRIALESLQEAPPEVREIVRYTGFPSTRVSRTIFHAIYRGPIVYYASPYEYVTYDYWWELSAHRVWLKIVRPRIIYVRLSRPVYLCEEPIIVRRVYAVRSTSYMRGYTSRRMRRADCVVGSALRSVVIRNSDQSAPKLRDGDKRPNQPRVANSRLSRQLGRDVHETQSLSRARSASIASSSSSFVQMKQRRDDGSSVARITASSGSANSARSSAEPIRAVRRASASQNGGVKTRRPETRTPTRTASSSSAPARTVKQTNRPSSPLRQQTSSVKRPSSSSSRSAVRTPAKAPARSQSSSSSRSQKKDDDEETKSQRSSSRSASSSSGSSSRKQRR